MRDQFRANTRTVHTVLRVIQDHGEIISSTLHEKLPISLSHANHIIAELARDGVIDRRRDGKRCVYSIKKGVDIDFSAAMPPKQRVRVPNKPVLQRQTTKSFTVAIERIQEIIERGYFRRAITELNSAHRLAVNEKDVATLLRLRNGCASKIKNRKRQKSIWFYQESEC